MANQELARLKIKRGHVKGQLTRIKHFMENYEDNNPIPLQARLQKAESLWDKFDDVQSSIECEFPDEDANERMEFENSYFTTISLLQEKISLLLSQQATPAAQQVQNTPQARLPTLQLPNFNGEYDKWLSFKDSFTSLIEAHPTLADIQKFQYLRSSVKGEAMQVIQSLQATAENYKVAWELLEKRYENKRLIVNTHIKALFELTTVYKENHMNLRKFIDTVRTHVRSLQSLDEPVNKWNTMIIFLLTTKLDFRTTKDWEEKLSNRPPDKVNDMPTLNEYLEFLDSRCQTLEMTDRNVFKIQKPEKKVTLTATSQQDKTQAWNCRYCRKCDSIYGCREFLKLPVIDRAEAVKKLHLCINCLRSGHFAQDCKSGACRICRKRHHSLLNRELKREESTIPQTEPQMENVSEQTNQSVATHCIQENQVQILLSTAEVFVFDNYGNMHVCRVLLDTGSQSNFMTENLHQKLKLKYNTIQLPVLRINNTSTDITKCTHVKIKSCTNKMTFELECLVVPRITGNLPQIKFDITNLKIPATIKLADTNFNVPGSIDILIGAELFWNLLCPNQISLLKGQPILQETKLGWILAGQMNNNAIRTKNTKCHVTMIDSLENQVERFWKTEEIADKKHLTPEEIRCEEYFQNTTTRDSERRFVVRLPKTNAIELGDSLETTIKRLHSLERRLERDSQLKTRYQEFMDDYLALGHMSLVSEKKTNENDTVYYLPHHPVVRNDSITTKVRVVFDGSAKTTSGAALNDLLLVGPTIQPDLINIVLRFRTHQYVLTADIAMMYRQITIHELDRNLQRICWRKDPTKEINHYTLNTVTYGTSSAPFLATRCLSQLAIEDGASYPLAKNILKNDFYMDDLLTGSPTKEEAIRLRQELTQLLSLGNFPLRKWRSNDPDILKELQEEPTDPLIVLNKQEPVKTLGLFWNSRLDTIQYSVTLDDTEQITKRSILSKIASIFDPLGLIGPVVTSSKLIMQQLWKQALEWDTPVPDSIKTAWLTFYKNLVHINQITIPRNINPNNLELKFDIHGFSDASEKAFGAAIYAVSTDMEGNTHCHLVCSKSRVAPLKTLSLPRLELNGALLLCKLTCLVQDSFKEKIKAIYHWTDSTIALTWIKTPPHLLKTFVSNRVAEIQRLSPDIQWYHVPSRQNPADVLSRGSTAETLATNKLWWSGPQFLSSTTNWPSQSVIAADENELELKPKVTLTITHKYNFDTIFTRFSSFQKLQRVIAYCKRFCYNTRNKENRKEGPLTVQELDEASISIIQVVQNKAFHEEMQDLKQNKEINRKSNLVPLNPFLDSQQIIRVGGRLKNANISIDQKHQIVLPSHHVVTQLIVEQYHKLLLHGGHEQVLSAIRQKYWPLSGRRVVKKIARNCLQCFRVHPKRLQHLMGNLPKEQIASSSRPFVSVGVDYAGPIQIKEGKRRGRIPISKAYIAVFICLATRAIHLELVSQLTTEAFLAAIQRFTARRGLCSNIFSDNATNFVGANQKLKEIYELVSANENQIANDLAKQNISWKFIPPRSPHFGGIWEAAVKSMKRHFYKVTQNLILTFEECYTLLTNIEACLNSRPLTPLSSNPSDLSALTPSHFLIGDSLLQPVEEQFSHVPDNRLSRWQHLQKVRQHFWSRWSKEYLHQLQTRSKWRYNSKNLVVGAMVLLVEDNLPPLKWVLGRVTALYPGEDGVVRVVSVQTASGTYKRAVRKLCELPISTSDLPVN